MWEKTIFKLDIEQWERSQIAFERKSSRCQKRVLVISKTLEMGKHIRRVENSRNIK